MQVARDADGAPRRLFWLDFDAAPAVTGRHPRLIVPQRERCDCQTGGGAGEFPRKIGANRWKRLLLDDAPGPMGRPRNDSNVPFRRGCFVSIRPLARLH
jgi:hypothetical protein